MAAITIPIPTSDEEQYIEVEVKINGERRMYNYRVEMFKWSDHGSPYEARIECLRRMIDNYDHNWQLFQIGNPTEEYIPIMFRERGSLDPAEAAAHA